MTLGETIDKAVAIQIELLTKQHEAEILALQDQLSYGAVGDMKWFCERVKLSPQVAKERILYPYRKELEGQCVKYAEGSGTHWQFNKAKVNEWIVDNFWRY